MDSDSSQPWPVNLSRDSLLASGGTMAPDGTGAIGPAIQSSTTFQRGPDNQLVDPNYLYSRVNAPHMVQLEGLFCQLEQGAAARLFSSGMGAVSAVLSSLPLGAHVVMQDGVYFAVRTWAQAAVEEGRLTLTLFDETRPETLVAALRPGETRLVWVESPSNPAWTVVDIAAAAQAAHGVGAHLVVDATASTPLLLQPLALGADLVVHSCTKYLNGHSDVLGGVVVTARDDALWEAITKQRSRTGAVMGAFEGYLLLRGLRTLHVRMDRICRSAQTVATFLQSHPAITRVLYPGLPGHPSHAIALMQMIGGYGGMLSFCVGQTQQQALDTLAAVALIRRATSFGGTESLMEHRRTVEDEHSTTPPNLLRLSVGLEAPEDLCADLDQALRRAMA